MTNDTMHMRILGELTDGRKTASIYRRSARYDCECVAVIILDDRQADAAAVADAICEAMDTQLAARRVN
jgi:hypothetical protein